MVGIFRNFQEQFKSFIFPHPLCQHGIEKKALHLSSIPTDIRPVPAAGKLEKEKHVVSRIDTKANQSTSKIFNWKMIATFAAALFFLFNTRTTMAANTMQLAPIQPYTPVNAGNPFYAFHERTDICLSPVRYSAPKIESLASHDFPFLTAIQHTPYGQSLHKKVYSADPRETLQASIDLHSWSAVVEPGLINAEFLKTHQGRIVQKMIDVAIKAGFALDQTEAIQKINQDLIKGTCFGTSLAVIKHVSAKLPINAYEFSNDMIFFQVASNFGFFDFIGLKTNLMEKISTLKSLGASQEDIANVEEALTDMEELEEGVYGEYLRLPDLQMVINQEWVSYTPDQKEKCISDFVELIDNHPGTAYLEIRISSAEHSIAVGLEDGRYFVQDINGQGELPASLEAPYRPLNTLIEFPSREEAIRESILYILNTYGQDRFTLEIVGYRYIS